MDERHRLPRLFTKTHLLYINYEYFFLSFFCMHVLCYE
jgi:hypothetical protein